MGNSLLSRLLFEAPFPKDDHIHVRDNNGNVGLTLGGGRRSNVVRIKTCKCVLSTTSNLACNFV